MASVALFMASVALLIASAAIAECDVEVRTDCNLEALAALTRGGAADIFIIILSGILTVDMDI